MKARSRLKTVKAMVIEQKGLLATEDNHLLCNKNLATLDIAQTKEALQNVFLQLIERSKIARRAMVITQMRGK